jgi:hypothetical protein
VKNEDEMEEIIRKIYHDVDKTKLMSGIYYFWNVMPSQMQANGILIQLFISEMNSSNALARKTKEIKVERKKEDLVSNICK